MFVHLEFLSVLEAACEEQSKNVLFFNIYTSQKESLDSCLKIIAWFDPRLASEESGPGRDALDWLGHQNKNTPRRSDYSAHSGVILRSASRYCTISI